MRIALLLVLSVCTAGAAAAAPAPQWSQEPGDYEVTLKVCGDKRDFLYHLPPCYDGTRKFPVVLVFHGKSASAKLVKKFSGMDETADKFGFIAVYPNGTGFSLFKGFNAGGSTNPKDLEKPDDVAFTNAILNQLERCLCVDCDRVYATGLSNGAMMCHRLAVELPNRITAIAPISGTLGTNVCPPKCPIPIMQFQGSCDEVLPMDGPQEKGLFASQTFYPTAQTMQFYACAAGCKAAPTITDLPDCVDDGTTIRLHTYTDCKPGIEVILVEICGGGHQWPQHGLPFKYLGTTSEEIDANEMMWCFFQKHTLSERGCVCGDGAAVVAKKTSTHRDAVTARVIADEPPVRR